MAISVRSPASRTPAVPVTGATAPWATAQAESSSWWCVCSVMSISLARHRSPDHDAQSLTGDGERLFHLVLRVALGEDEAQIAVALRQRADPLAQGDSDDEAG